MRPLFLRSTFAGAPILSGSAGAMQAVLNACLINGFHVVPLTSLTQSGGTATATVVTGHGFDNDTCIRLSGANEADYRGDFWITVTGTNTFTFPISSSAQTTASGTISAKYAPLDWEAAFTSTDATRTVYRSKDETSNRLYLRVLDNHDNPLQDTRYGHSFKSATVTMYERMTDVDSGFGASRLVWRKAQSLSALSRPWILIGDSKRFWLVVAWSETYPNIWQCYFFGDVTSFKPGDKFNTILTGYWDGSWGVDWDTVYAGYYGGYMNTIWTGVGNNNGYLIARPYSAFGSSVNVHWIGPYTGWIGRHSASTYPNPCDGGLLLSGSLWIQEGGSFPTVRGIVPGIFSPMNQWPLDPAKQYTEYYENFMVNGVAKKFICIRGNYHDGQDRLAFDLTGPWE